MGKMIGKMCDEIVECLESGLYIYSDLIYDKINFQVH